MKNNREFLMLADSYVYGNHIANMFVSEKMDGMRAIWLPETRNYLVKEIPFANLQKDVMGNGERICSGLWSRYGNPIWAPDWFVAKLPGETFLDGELWGGRGQFQKTMSTVKKKEPIDSEWKAVKFHVFDIPWVGAFCQRGKIHNMQWQHFDFPREKSLEIFKNRMSIARTFSDVRKLFWENETKWFNEVCVWHGQFLLSPVQKDAERDMLKILDEIIEGEGEGLILRRRDSYWTPERVKTMVKVKKYLDSEASVVGWNGGKGRLIGMMGNLIVHWVNSLGKIVRFEIGTGFTDEERKGPEKYLGKKVTFRYREETKDGIPKEARFERLKIDE